MMAVDPNRGDAYWTVAGAYALAAAVLTLWSSAWQA